MSEELYMDTQVQNAPLSEEARYLEQMFAPHGWGTMMMTPIGKLSIVPEQIAVAFQSFPDSVEVGKTFTVTELLTTPELVFNRTEVIGKEGDGIYLLTEPVADPTLRRSLMQNSVPGLCGLLQATHGVELNVPDAVPFEKLLTSRFLILRERDGERFCRTDVVKMVRVGSLCAEKLRVKRRGDTVAEYRLSDLLPMQAVELTVGSDGLEAYEQAFSGALAYGCCAMFAGEYYLNFAVNPSFSSFVAGAIGLFFAMMRYRFALPTMRFVPNGRIGLVVPRPSVAVGDSVYAFRPKCGADSRPVPAELTKLQRYLADAVRNGKIKSVLPLKKNAREMMEKLGDGVLQYVAQREFPTDCFAVLAILPSGSEAPATLLGSFQFR